MASWTTDQQRQLLALVALGIGAHEAQALLRRSKYTWSGLGHLVWHTSRVLFGLALLAGNFKLVRHLVREMGSACERCQRIP